MSCIVVCNEARTALTHDSSMAWAVMFFLFFFLMYKLLCSYRNIKKVKISHIFLPSPLSVESLMRTSDLTDCFRVSDFKDDCWLESAKVLPNESPLGVRTEFVTISTMAPDILMPACPMESGDLCNDQSTQKSVDSGLCSALQLFRHGFILYRKLNKSICLICIQMCFFPHQNQTKI